MEYDSFIFLHVLFVTVLANFMFCFAYEIRNVFFYFLFEYFDEVFFLVLSLFGFNVLVYILCFVLLAVHFMFYFSMTSEDKIY